MSNILVIGAGVIGLTTAITLLKAGYSVTIYSKAVTPHLTSDVAAAFWSPFRCFPEDKVLAWSSLGKSVLETQYLNQPNSGCINRLLKAIYQEPFDHPYWLSLAKDASSISTSELPSGYTGGFQFKTVVIDTKYYMPYLMEEFKKLGGALEDRHIHNLSDIQNPFEGIVNCCGLESRELFSDEALYPSRGQVIAIQPNGFTELIRDERKRLLIVPRTDDIILGAVVDDGNWDTTIQEHDTERIIREIELIFPDYNWRDIITIKSGLRPMRNAIRLEKETINGQPVIHNYGHGGGGYTVAWGCAQEVLSLLQ